MKNTPVYTMLVLPFLLACITLEKEAGTWQVFETKNNVSGRSECGFAAVNGMLYLIGGDGPAAAVEMLDPQSKTWTKKAMAPVIMHHFQAVQYNNKIYVLDAFSGGSFPNQLSMANVYSYDTQKDEWNKQVEIPVSRRRAGAGAAIYHGKIYLVCGITNGHSSGTNNMFDVYDPQTNTWDSLPGAPHIRDHCMAAVVHDKLYVVGGRNTSYRDPNNKITFFSQTVLDVDCYDFITGKWSALDAKLPLGTGGGALVNFNNLLYYMGGERATDTERNAPRKNTFYFDPSSTNGWIATADLNQARNGTAAAVLNNKIYLAGGSGGGPPPNGPMQGGKPPNGFVPGDTSHRPPPPPGGGPQGPGGGKIVVEVFSLK
jgi:N-acetylneuraminic acid mutarotase